MGEIVMIRHGQASFGKENYDVLSERGSRQSLLLSRYFLETQQRFDAAYTGTLERQKKTAQIILSALRERGVPMKEPEVMPGFDEYDTRSIIKSQMEDLLREDPSLHQYLDTFFTSRKSFQMIFERAMTRWVSGLHHYDGIETWASFQERVREGIKAIMKRHGGKSRVLVVASGGSISASVQYAAGLSGEETMNLCWRMVNSSVTRLVYNDSRVTLHQFNGYPHLELFGDKDDITYR